MKTVKSSMKGSANPQATRVLRQYSGECFAGPPGDPGLRQGPGRRRLWPAPPWGRTCQSPVPMAAACVWIEVAISCGSAPAFVSLLQLGVDHAGDLFPVRASPAGARAVLSARRTRRGTHRRRSPGRSQAEVTDGRSLTVLYHSTCTSGRLEPLDELPGAVAVVGSLKTARSAPPMNDGRPTPAGSGATADVVHACRVGVLEQADVPGPGDERAEGAVDEARSRARPASAAWVPGRR